jgi:cell division protease FtsH
MNRFLTAFADTGDDNTPTPPPEQSETPTPDQETSGKPPHDPHAPPPPGTPPKKAPRPPMQTFVFWFILLFALPLTIYFLGQDKSQDADKLTQSGFEKILRDGRVKKAVIVRESGSGIRYIKGQYLPPDTTEQNAEPATPVDFRTEVVYTEELDKLIRANCENYSTENVSDIWGSLLVSILPILILVALIYFLFSRQMQAAGRGALQFGKSRARLMSPTQEQVTFKDVAGCNEAKDEVSEIVAFLKAPERFQQIGGRIPKGVMMVGPPGTGKTLLARAIAGEAKVPFFSISGSDFVEMFVGVGASRVRDMFEEGKRHAPCIIFIDEIDAVGRSRFSGIGGGHDEREQTLNALLAEMDGFEANTGIIVIAATNRPDVLDPALMRPGRFDRRIAVDLPDMEGRTKILEIHAARVKMKEETDLKTIAKGTPGFSGADLANLINEAALAAARDDKKEIDLSDLEEARDKVRWGRERRSRKIDEHDKKITAFHEAGHTLIGLLTKNSTPVHKVTIIPRGTAYLGATMNLPEKDRYTQSLSEIQAELDVLMGGRLAERLVFDDITSGAAMDLRRATEIARRMVCEWGMSPKLGPLSYGNRSEHIYLGRDITRTEDYSEETAREIDQEIKRIISEAEDRAEKLLKENLEKLNTLGNTLLERETMSAEEICKLLDIHAGEDDE